MSPADFIKRLMAQADVTAATIPIPVRAVWFPTKDGNVTVFDVAQPNPLRPDSTVVAIFKGMGECRVYVMPGEESKDPPSRLTLTMMAPTMSAETFTPALFEAAIASEYRALAPAEDDEDDEGSEIECTACGAEMPPTFAHCGECGVALPHEVACPKCAEKMPSHFEFCSDCGTKMEADAAVP